MQQLFGFTDRISTVLVMLTHMTRMIRISSMTDSEDPESVKGSGFAISNDSQEARPPYIRWACAHIQVGPAPGGRLRRYLS